MRRMRTKILTLSLVFLGACTAAQFETFKRVSAATPRIIAQIATAYGSPYAIAIQTFADAIAPAPESSEGQQGTFETSPVLSARDDEMKSTGTVDAPVAEQKLTAQIDIVQEVVKDGRPVAVPVKNGDVLTEDDNYKVQISCNMDCYAYIAQLDATGKMDPILPSNFAAIENPLSGTTSYSIPGGNKWFFLDSNVGVEQVYFIMSKTRRTDIEDIFQEITAQRKPDEEGVDID